MPYTDIIVEKKGAAAWLIINKPQVKNAMGRQTLKEMLSALDELESDPAVIVVAFRGAGGTFCSGMDIREISGPTDPRAKETTVLADKFFRRIEKFRKVTIAVVEGYCMAGGFEITLGCDFVIAEENAKIGDGHMKLANFVPNGGASVMLPRLVGLRAAKEILYTGDLVSGAQAERMGIVNRAVPAAQLEQTAADLISRLVDKSPVGLEYMKRLVDNALEISIEEGLQAEHDAVEAIGKTQDHEEALRAFKEKRKPKFTGK